MPYAIRGNTVVKADSGKVVGHSANPTKYLHTLLAVEHGWKPTRKKKKKSLSALHKLTGGKHG